MIKRYFKISGNFQQNGRWSTPDPGFVGYIVVDDDNVFEGYMDEQYSMASGSEPSRFVTGIYKEKEAKLAFYKLTASVRHASLLYIFPSVSEIGQWIIFDNGVTPGGPAKVKLDPIPVDEQILEKIQEIKKRIVENGPEWNMDLASRAGELFSVFDVRFP